ncbi:pilus assembly protein PilM [Pseudomonas capeferrum]|uniref:type IV pilus biogenesis protein PilM n=1 Tax=Pseudomonas capeferrum TaxID=1495066 RepID=UPI0015E2BA04|nr:pilus assembly protein PilM [Pseudomonas capeferrum]MBA1202357.1 pilus assembly protein PilM [Pseudomonas capeferrum]
MLGRFGRDAGSLLGVEIAPDSVRLMQVQRRRGHACVQAWALEPFEAQAFQDGWISAPEPVIAALRTACRRSKSRQRKVAVALSGSQVICKVHHMPAGLGEATMETRLLVEADRFIPFPLDDLALDFHVLGPSRSHPGQVDVMIAACRQSLLEPLEQLLEAAGLRAGRVEVDSFALASVLPRSGQEASAVLQIETGQATLHAWNGTVLPQRHELPPGPIDAAWLDGLVLLVEAHAARCPLERLLLAGPGGARAAILPALETRLGIACEVIDPLVGLHLAGVSNADALRAQGSAMALACGLALGGLA